MESGSNISFGEYTIMYNFCSEFNAVNAIFEKDDGFDEAKNTPEMSDRMNFTQDIDDLSHAICQTNKRRKQRDFCGASQY